MIGRVLLAVIGFYSRAISPALPPRCRFYPTCSAYAAQAITRHGAARGSWLAVRRLLSCGPWHPGGVDLVPEAGRPSGTGGAGRSSSTAVPSPVLAGLAVAAGIPTKPPRRTPAGRTRSPDLA